MTPFRDRRDAGRKLAKALAGHAADPGLIVLGLPRGGVIVAAEVARALRAELDVLVVRKLGTPGHEELAMGAIGPGGIRVLNPDVVGPMGISEKRIAAVADAESRELERRDRLYRGNRPALSLSGRTVLLVDDGLATGATMRAAVAVVRAGNAGRIVVAVPCAPPDTAEALSEEADEVVALLTPPHFRAVGEFYLDFGQTPDSEVVGALAATGTSR